MDRKLAIVHEWLAVRAGSEKVFEAMALAYPEADLYALTWDREAEFDFGGRPVTTTFLDRSKLLRDKRELGLPLMPLAWRTIDVSDDYDVVLSSCHAFVRHFPPAKTAIHYCYCHTPLRYAWVPELDRRTERRIPLKSSAEAALRWLDSRTVKNVDYFAANSTTVRDRIRECYGRDSVVIHPPVDVDFYSLPEAPVERSGVLAVSRFVPYKSVRLALEAAAAAGVPITIAGKGPEEASLRQLAVDLKAEARFEISPSDERLRELYRESSALVFPANEDFGIIPVEAQACGTPVVALDLGGARDTVVQGETGIRVARQEVAEFADAIRQVVDSPPAPEVCRANAEGFSSQRFAVELKAWMADSLS
ncbi:MAG: glycosyltransferase [Solirubrobacterales bacterium]